jgi:hypothetical protein
LVADRPPTDEGSSAGARPIIAHRHPKKPDNWRGLGEHENPGEATVHVLQGRVRLNGDGHEWEGSPCDLLIVPSARRTFDAVEDSGTIAITV